MKVLRGRIKRAGQGFELETKGAVRGKVQGHIALGQDGEERLDLRQSICEQLTDQERGMEDQGNSCTLA